MGIEIVEGKKQKNEEFVFHILFVIFQIIYQDAVKMLKILNTQTKGANLCEVFTHQ